MWSMSYEITMCDEYKEIECRNEKELDVQGRNGR